MLGRIRQRLISLARERHRMDIADTLDHPVAERTSRAKAVAHDRDAAHGTVTRSPHHWGVAKFGGASYEVAAAATSRMTPPFGGYHRLKLRMSCPFRAALRTCSNAFAPSLVHRMCPLRFMR